MFAVAHSPRRSRYFDDSDRVGLMLLSHQNLFMFAIYRAHRYPELGFAPGQYSPGDWAMAATLSRTCTAGPFAVLIPPLGGFDISPIFRRSSGSAALTRVLLALRINSGILDSALAPRGEAQRIPAISHPGVMVYSDSKKGTSVMNTKRTADFSAAACVLLSACGGPGDSAHRCLRHRRRARRLADIGRSRGALQRAVYRSAAACCCSSEYNIVRSKNQGDAQCLGSQGVRQ